MKMPKDRYERIKTAITEKLESIDPAEVAAFKGRVNSVRFRWGLLSRAFPGGTDFDLYADGINDDHIDTALRHIVVELGLEG